MGVLDACALVTPTGTRYYLMDCGGICPGAKWDCPDVDEMADDDDLAPLRDLPEFKAVVSQTDIILGLWEKLLKSDPAKLPKLLSRRASECAKTR